jgi:hypothetical protein
MRSRWRTAVHRERLADSPHKDPRHTLRHDCGYRSGRAFPALHAAKGRQGRALAVPERPGLGLCQRTVCRS